MKIIKTNLLITLIFYGITQQIVIADSIDFEKKVLPILQEKCWGCHSSRIKAPDAGLLLDTPQNILNGTLYGPVISKSDAKSSILVERIEMDPNKRGIMPPKGKGDPCSPQEIQIIKDWINEGAQFKGWLGYKKPKVEYQVKDQKNNSVLSAFAYGKNPDNPLLNLNPMPNYRMVVMQSYAKSKSEQIDKFVYNFRNENNISHPKIINDKIFLRRAYLGIIGRIPTVKESMRFLSSNKNNKRSLLIDELLNSEGYVSNWFHFWADLLKVDSTKRNITASVYYAEWIKQALRSNMPYDLLVKNLITATGMPHQNGATGWIASDENMRPDHMANTVQAFLGCQIQCAQCHDHPFDRWNQYEFQSMVSYYAGVQYNIPGGNQVFIRKAERANADDKLTPKQDRFFRYMGGKYILSIWEPNFQKWHTLPFDYQYADAMPRQALRPKVMYGEQPHINESPRKAFATWVTSDENNLFSETLINRLWKHLMGVGLIEPIDEIKYSTEPSMPELMEFLSEMVIEFDYNLKDILKVLYNTKTWQMDTIAYDLPENLAEYKYEGRPLMRMTGEQIWDSIMTLIVVDADQRKGHGSKFVTDEYRKMLDEAITMPIEKFIKTFSDEKIDAIRKDEREKTKEAYKIFLTNNEGKRQRESKIYSSYNFSSWSDEHMTDPRWKGIDRGFVLAYELPSPAPGYHFIRQFGQSDRQTIASGTEDPNVTQSLVLLNGPIYYALNRKPSLLQQNLSYAKSNDQRITLLFRSILSRNPTEDDLSLSSKVINDNGTYHGTKMITWSLLNTREFIYIQ